ncbi:MAG: tetratricopeptide repeat protein [Deltaproteobacteria bacterium]|nr:tetratricopeptide repeat protein [Deltaproteobacteria bacterium]
MASGLDFTKAVLIFLLVITISQLSAETIFSKVLTSSAREYRRQGEVNREEIRKFNIYNSAATFFSQGLAYYDQGRWYEAVEAFEKAALAEPDYALAYFGMGITYSRLEFWEKALASFAKTVTLSPSYAEAYLGLGVAYTVLGRNNDALEVCRKAVEVKPDYAQAHYALALIYLKLGDQASALEEWGVLRELDKSLADEVIRYISDVE